MTDPINTPIIDDWLSHFKFIDPAILSANTADIRKVNAAAVGTVNFTNNSEVLRWHRNIQQRMDKSWCPPKHNILEDITSKIKDLAKQLSSAYNKVLQARNLTEWLNMESLLESQSSEQMEADVENFWYQKLYGYGIDIINPRAIQQPQMVEKTYSIGNLKNGGETALGNIEYLCCGKTTFDKPDRETLPKGWEEYKDGEGRAYYYNAASGETSWEFPDPDLPTGSTWQPLFSDVWTQKTTSQIITQINTLNMKKVVILDYSCTVLTRNQVAKFNTQSQFSIIAKKFHEQQEQELLSRTFTPAPAATMIFRRIARPRGKRVVAAMDIEPVKRTPKEAAKKQEEDEMIYGGSKSKKRKRKSNKTRKRRRMPSKNKKQKKHKKSKKPKTKRNPNKRKTKRK